MTTEPNPAIDLAKARADFDNRHAADSEVSLASWAAIYGDLLLTALEQMQWRGIESAPKDGSSFIGAVPYDDGSWRIDRMHWTGYTSRPGGYFQSLSTKLIQGLGHVKKHQPTNWKPLGNTPGDTPHAD